MAHSLSAKKRVRQNAKRRNQNRSLKNSLKAQLKRFVGTTPTATVKATSGGEAKNVETKPADPVKEFVTVQKRLDQLAAKGVLHPNTAARRKSRLAHRAKVAAALAASKPAAAAPAAS